MKGFRLSDISWENISSVVRLEPLLSPLSKILLIGEERLYLSLWPKLARDDLQYH